MPPFYEVKMGTSKSYDCNRITTVTGDYSICKALKKLSKPHFGRNLKMFTHLTKNLIGP